MSASTLLWLALGTFLAQTGAVERPLDPAPAATDRVVATEYVVEEGRLIAVQGSLRTELAMPGSVAAVARRGQELYVARGSSVLVYDVSEPLRPRLAREIAVGRGTARAFHEADGELWVVVESRAALPLGGFEPITAAASPAKTGARAPELSRSKPAALARTIPILRVRPGSVELGLGSKHGVRPGDRFSIFRSTDQAGEAGSGFVGEELVAVATVIAVKAETSLAELGRGAEVRPGDEARRAAKGETSSTFLPRAPSDLGELSAVLRPLVNAGKPLGAGVLADLSASYWLGSGFLGVRLQPVGLGGTDEGSIVSTSALAEGGYEGQVFAVGLGAGISWVNGDMDYMLRSFGGARASADAAGGDPTRIETQETHSAFTLSQVARLGARDGLNLAIQNLLIYHEDEEALARGDDEGQAGFIYGGTSARLAIPVSTRSDLFLEGGGGLMGYWFAGAGVSTWIRGNGVPGSVRLSVSAGGAGISGSREVTETYPDATGQPVPYTYTDSISVNGPMVAAGLAYRFAL